DAGVELPAGRRELALHPDGSIRSIQIQVETAVGGGKALQVRFGRPATTPPLALVPVSTTLSPSDGTQGPRVWARLPASWLVASGLVGPQLTEAETDGTVFDVWDDVCDFENHTVTRFLELQGS